MTKRLTINEVFKDYTDGGLFEAIYNLDNNLWSKDDSMLLHLEMLNNYGERYISKVFKNLLGDDMKIDSASRILNLLYNNKWGNIKKSLYAEYNPISNYNMIEIENVGSELKTSVANDYQGFNSTDYSNNERVTTIASGDSTKNERKLTREGNVGVTSNQQMINSEVEMRNKYTYFKIVLEDVMSYISLLVYE